MMPQRALSLFIGSVVFVWAGLVWADGPEPENPPQNVQAVRQDFQAARVTWDSMGKNMKYFLYVSYDREPLDFHKENDGRPLSDHFAIWDAPRKGPRRFVFYVTGVDPENRETQPSKMAHVDLGPRPEVPR